MKKQTVNLLSGLLIGALVFVSCQKSDQTQQPTPDQQVPSSVLSQIKAKGFSTKNVQQTDDGYLVEGDILLSKAFLESDVAKKSVVVAKTEQYTTTNLVKSLPRTITVKVVNLGTAYVAGTDTAIARYNRLGLSMTFQRITTGTADITISGFNQGPRGGFITLGYAGFPTDGGDPHNEIKMNTNRYAYGSNPSVLYVGSVIQHEIGHCIGMRHTDYMDRSYSCGGEYDNEGPDDVGAEHIPGTPSEEDANSWMLACSNGGNRTFNANDIIALKYLYE